MRLQRKISLVTVVSITLLLLLASSGMCRNYITVEEVKARIDAGDVEKGLLVITTAQTEKEYKTGYIKEAIPTFARPLKSDADFAKLIPVLNKVKDSDADIVFICPRGKSGATRPYDYFKKNGVSEDRMMVMEGGQGAFNKAFPESVSYPEQ